MRAAVAEELPSMAPPASAEEVRARAEREFLTFRRLSGWAHSLHAGGRDDAAIVAAEVAATYAAFRDPGLFASYELEHLLLDIGRTHLRDAGRRRRSPSQRGHVLHVATRALAVGGHTRLIARWMNRDDGRTHSLAVTAQGGERIPEYLAEAVRRSGGSIHRLTDSPSGPIGWAKRLRRLGLDADFVVLYTFPYDSLPTLAFADRTGLPPILFVDQADHEFWLGVLASDVIVSLRHSGQRFAIGRRHVEPERTFLLPIPLDGVERRTAREDAKAALGLSPEKVLMLSVARGRKYGRFEGELFFEPFLPLLRDHPDLVLMVVGPDEDDDWRAAQAATGGRIIVPGPQLDARMYFEAADIYLDSFPINSITSMLEAGSHGLPIVTRNAFPGDPGILGGDTPGLDPCVLRVDGAEELRGMLGRLLADPLLRQQLGDETRQSIAGAHMGEGWDLRREELYRFASEVPRNPGTKAVPDRSVVEAVDVGWASVYRREERLQDMLKLHMRRMPLDRRLRMFARLRNHGFAVGIDRLLPEWTIGHLRRLKRRAPSRYS